MKKLAGLLLLCTIFGCVHVRPHQREDLARMDEELQRAEATRDYEAHMWSVREAAGGGDGQAGGGCGCN